jgi:hypothetical protein
MEIMSKGRILIKEKKCKMGETNYYVLFHVSNDFARIKPTNKCLKMP